MNLTKNQYWLVILLGFLLIGVNGYLVLKLVNKDINLDYDCPVPVDEIDHCECSWNAFDNSLRSCICYPGSKGLETLDGFILNLSDGAARDS